MKEDTNGLADSETSKPLHQRPELKLHPTAPELTALQRTILEGQWHNFWMFRDQPQVIEPFNGTIGEGWLVHQTRYEPLKVDAILEAGVVSGELGFVGKKPIAEDGETHFCADFFVNQETQDVKTYTERATTPAKTSSGLKSPQMEHYSVPANNKNLAFVIDPNKLPQELLHYSTTGLDKDRGVLKDWPIRFPYDSQENATRHLAILVGIPANYINGIVVGEQLAVDSESITHLKNSILKTQLSIPLYTSAGIRIS